MANLDPNDSRAPYLQVADKLRAELRDGALSPGDQLPTHKALANDYGVAINTVKSALALLRDEGLITTQHGKGSYVRSLPSEAGERSSAEVTSALSQIQASLVEIQERLAKIEDRLTGPGQTD